MKGNGDGAAPERTWFLEPEPAIAALRKSWKNYRAIMAAQTDWWAELGDAWGPWSRHSIVDMAMHASNELVHHGAEVALLRDLYRQRADLG